MIRYVGQRDKFRCCPIAILNMLKWLRISGANSCTLRRITKMAQCSYPDGVVDRRPVEAALRRLTKNLAGIKRNRNPTIRSITHHLQNTKGFVIINSLHYEKEDGTWWGHYFAIAEVGRGGKRFKAINYYTGATTTTITSSDLKKNLRRHERDGYIYPSVWLVTKL